ncbi:Protein OS-9 [Paramarasmius palmivorus]|uniref:Protein OS-9 homolog n=1 Tax=Paramarasmius palmivorus TaxID=297713 RepID=A0AAW0DTP8_9AGAR
MPNTQSTSYSLEHMKMGPRDSYLCFIPAPLDLPPPPSDEAAADTQPDEVTTANSWSLLQDLSGQCLYHRQGWFTYSYCHNHEIRQFKELPQSNSHVPEEDPTWESYTLGKAPVTPQPGADLTVAERNAIATNLELARGAGSRYLVQRWGDGTICGVTGKPREVEVQFHCSMVMSDTILFVKEAKTCSYVLVINTPRLCGEPGFRSRRDTADQAHIKCREIISSSDAKQELFSVPDNDYPQKIPRPKLNLPASASSAKGGTSMNRKTLASIKGQGFQEGSVFIEVLEDDDDEFAIGLDIDENLIEVEMERIAKALKAAGIDVKGHKGSLKNRQSEDKKSSGGGSEQSSSSSKQQGVRDDVRVDDDNDGHRDEL